MDMYKEDYGLACVSDGATVNRTPLVNVLAVVMSSVMLLSVVDCSGYMAEGGKKDGSFIAKEMAILGHKYFFLAILDGASNLQSAGRILMALNKQLTVVHCALHLVHLIFGQIALISEVAALIESYRVIRNWIYCHHFNHDLFKSLVMEANKGKFVDSRMGGHFMCLWRLLRLRNALIQMVTHPKYVEQNYKDDPIRDFIMDEVSWHQVYSLLRAVWPLILLLRLGDTNGAVMGFQVKCTISTKIKIDKAIEQDTANFT